MIGGIPMESSRLPSRKWSIVALGSAGMLAVVLSYVLATALAGGFLALPVVFFAVLPIDGGSFIIARLLLSAFGLVAGCTILWSLVPQKAQTEIAGVKIDLGRETRLAEYIGEIASALHEPMPSEVYLTGDANAFVQERGGFLGMGSQRIMALGLPLMQMLTISQFRAVVAHEFAHYYAGDTSLGPWVYNARGAILRVYQNLGQKSELISLLTRWAVVAIPYMVLMGSMRLYWNGFMRITQMISRQQEYRSDEIACSIAGSQPLIEGLQTIRRCQAVLRTYWSSVVLPVASGGFQPQVADGFLRFMNAPPILKATSEYLEKQIGEEKTNPFDTHPPLNKRIERARTYNRSVQATGSLANGSEIAMISLMNDLDGLESSLLKKLVPALANSPLKPVRWERAELEVYVPIWRRQIEGYLPQLSSQVLRSLPAFVVEPGAIAEKVPIPKGMLLNWEQRKARAAEILSCALALSLFDHGWKLLVQPGIQIRLEHEGVKLDPFAAVAAMKSGKLSAQQWEANCSAWGVGEFPLAGQGLEPETE